MIRTVHSYRSNEYKSTHRGVLYSDILQPYDCEFWNTSGNVADNVLPLGDTSSCFLCSIINVRLCSSYDLQRYVPEFNCFLVQLLDHLF